MLDGFGCLAAFLREVQRGYALSNIYDTMIFCSPPMEQANWEEEHNGKKVSIPRPVTALRVWNSATQSYDEISAHMPGAPTPEEREAYWLSFLDELRAALNPRCGEDFIDDCLRLPPADVKAKYTN